MLKQPPSYSPKGGKLRPGTPCVLSPLLWRGRGRLYNILKKEKGKQLFSANNHLHLVLSSRKEVFQPHLPVRLPCYDLTPVTSFTLGRSLRLQTSGTPSFHCLTGGVYKARERIHRIMADMRLLANPASRSRVADFDPN